MQVSVEATSGLERRMTIGLPEEVLAREVEERLARTGSEIRLNGLCSGKLPVRVVRQRFGNEVRNEVLGELMLRSFQDAVEAEKLAVAGQPVIEEPRAEQGQDVEFVAVFEVYPEVELKDYTSLEVERPVSEVTDADVETMIELFRKQRGSWVEVERAAAEGDRVVIDYVGTRDGEAFEGGSGEGVELELGSGRMIPGFEDGLAGLAAGEEKTLSLSFPEDYHNEELQGAAVEFSVTVNAVQEHRPAELNDAFFAAFGVTEGGEQAFRDEVRQNMARELDRAARTHVKNQVLSGLLALHDDLEVPSSLVSAQIEQLRGQTMQQFGGMPQDFDLRQLLPDQLFEGRARRRVRLGLVLRELLESRDIEPSAEQVRVALEEHAATYEEPQEVINWFRANPEQLQDIESMVAEDLLVESLVAEAQVTEAELNYEALMEAARASSEEMNAGEAEEEAEEEAADAEEEGASPTED